jgi:hypothetical protein
LFANVPSPNENLEPVQAQPKETAEELRERLRAQYRSNSNKRLLAARQVLSRAVIPPPPPLTTLSPSKSPSKLPGDKDEEKEEEKEEENEEEDRGLGEESRATVHVAITAQSLPKELKEEKVVKEIPAVDVKTVAVAKERSGGGESTMMKLAKQIEDASPGRKQMGEMALACARLEQEEEAEERREAMAGQRDGAVSARERGGGGGASFFLTQEGSMGEKIAALGERPIAEANRPEWRVGGIGKTRPASAAVPGRRGRGIK